MNKGVIGVVLAVLIVSISAYVLMDNDNIAVELWYFCDGDLYPVDVNVTGDYIKYEIVNLSIDSLHPCAVPWSDETPQKTPIVIYTENFSKSEYTFNWVYVDTDGDGFISESDQIILYNITNYSEVSTVILKVTATPVDGGVCMGELKGETAIPIEEE